MGETASGRNRKIISLVLVIACAAVMTTGCWDRREIEEQTTVVALALDRHEDGIQVTIQVPIPTKIVGGGGSGGDGGGGQEAVQLFTASGQDLTDALMHLQKQLNYDLVLGQMRLVVISEALARSGLEDLIDALVRMPEIRRRLWPVIVEGQAKKALEADPKLEQIPAVYLIDMIENEVRRKRQFNFNLGRFVSKLMDEAEQPLLNQFKVSDKSMSWVGAALFRGDHMIGKLDELESAVLMQMRREGRTGYRVYVPCPGQEVEEVTFEPERIMRDVAFHERPLRFNMHITVEGHIVEKTCKEDLSQESYIHALERALKRKYEGHARRTIRKMQHLQTDALQLGTEIRAFHPRTWKRIDWADQFPRTAIDVTYDVYITGRGARYK